MKIKAAFTILHSFLIFIVISGCESKNDITGDGSYYSQVHIIRPVNEQVLQDTIDGEKYPKTPEIIISPSVDSSRNYLADWYHVQIALDPDFRNIVKDSTDTFYQKSRVPEYKKNDDGSYILDEKGNRTIDSYQEVITQVIYYPEFYLPKLGADSSYYFCRARAHYPKNECGSDAKCTFQSPGYGPFSDTVKFHPARDTLYVSIPVIAEIGSSTIGSYGLMIVLCFITGTILLRIEFKRRKYQKETAYSITFFAIISSIIGAKLFIILQSAAGSEITSEKSISQIIFSPGIFSLHGGYIVGTLAPFIYCAFKKNINFRAMADTITMMLPLVYSIALLGAQLSAGCEAGIKTSFIFGLAYQEVFTKTGSFYMHPIPLYEFFFNIIFFIILWIGLRKRNIPDGIILFLYLIMFSVPRFLLEFISRNKIIFGSGKGMIHFDTGVYSLQNLTLLQIIAVITFLIGISGLIYSIIKRKSLSRENFNTN